MKRWRHLIIAVLLVPAISVYVMLCLYLSGFVVGIHWSLDLAYFLAAGLALAVSGWPGHQLACGNGKLIARLTSSGYRHAEYLSGRVR